MRPHFDEIAFAHQFIFKQNTRTCVHTKLRVGLQIHCSSAQGTNRAYFHCAAINFGSTRETVTAAQNKISSLTLLYPACPGNRPVPFHRTSGGHVKPVCRLQLQRLLEYLLCNSVRGHCSRVHPHCDTSRRNNRVRIHMLTWIDNEQSRAMHSRSSLPEHTIRWVQAHNRAGTGDRVRNCQISARVERQLRSAPQGDRPASENRSDPEFQTSRVYSRGPAIMITRLQRQRSTALFRQPIAAAAHLPQNAGQRQLTSRPDRGHCI